MADRLLKILFKTFKPFNRYAEPGLSEAEGFKPPPSSSPALRGRKEVGVAAT
jgi:hypothetical protein